MPPVTEYRQRPANFQPSQTPPPHWRGDLIAGQGFDLALRPDGQVVVAWVSRGSPAESHNVEPGSYIKNWDVLNRGTAPPWIKITFVTPEGIVRHAEFSATDEQALPTWSCTETKGGIRRVRFDKFDDISVSRATEQLKSNRNSLGVLLDLRRNMGGETKSLARFLESLLGPNREIGTIVQSGRRYGWSTGRGPDPLDTPLSVLLGVKTQSSAEVAAATLRYYKRAVLVGEPTGGQVLGGRQYSLSDGGVLGVATQDFLDQSGHRLEHRGVLPDIYVRETLSAIRADEDLVVDAAEKQLLKRDL
jgi:C-terminal processing protease CtpA/Prc